MFVVPLKAACVKSIKGRVGEGGEEGEDAAAGSNAARLTDR